MPPVSKVTALPTSAERRARRRRSAARSSAAPRASPSRPPAGRPSRGSAISSGPKRLALEPLDLGHAAERVLGELHRGEVVGRAGSAGRARRSGARPRCPCRRPRSTGPARTTISSCSGRCRRRRSSSSCSGRTGRRRAACPRPAPRRDRRLVHAVGHRPGDALGARVAGAAERDRRRDARTLGVELVALAEADGDHARGADRAVGMQDRRLLERRPWPRPTRPAGRAGRRAPRRVPAGGLLALEQADAERVGVGRRGGALAEGGAHGRRKYRCGLCDGVV